MAIFQLATIFHWPDYLPC